MQQPDDHPDSIAQRLIEALTATRRPPQAVLDEYRELRAWDPDQLDTLMQAFDAAHAERRLPDSVHATVRNALKRWRRDARNASTDQMPALPDRADWTEEMQPPDPGEDTGELQRDEVPGAGERSAAARAAPMLPGSAAAPANLATPAAAPAPALEAGPGVVLLGRYELESLAGSGGTALVYRARDRRRDAADGELQHLAIKIPRPDLADPERAVARLKREFRQTRALPHPNIVGMLDLDCDRGLWFITMDWLEGESLAARIKRCAPEPLPAQEAWPILRSCAQALAFAHGRGIVHGDFKPSNVMVAPDGEAHLLDFGAAPDASTSAESADGEDRRTLATRCYASPEALAGEPPDARDDLFSLACVAYEMFAGVHPFQRRAADVACADAAVPAPVEALGAAQSAALLRGLAWRREDRPFGVLTWLDALIAAADAPDEAGAPSPASAVPASAVLASAVPASDAPAFHDAAHAAGVEGVPPTVAVKAAVPRASTPRLGHGQRTTSLVIGAGLLVAAALVFNARNAADRAAAPDLMNATPAPATTPLTSRATATGSDRGGKIAPPPSSGAAARTRAARTPDVAARVAPGTVDTGRGTAAARSDGHAAPADRATRTGGTPGTAVARTVTPTAPTRRISLDAPAVSVNEGAFAAVITLRREGDRRGAVAVRWRIEGGSAEPGQDFSGPVAGTARFTSGQTVRTLYVRLVDDGIREGPETFTVSVSPASPAAAPGSITRSIVTIQDDD